MRLILLVTIAGCLLGCLRDDLPKEKIEGRYVTYFHDADHAPCTAVVPSIDRFVDDLDQRFGLELPDGFRFNYFHLEDPETGDERLPEICSGAAACTLDSGVYSPVFAQLHEVAHAALIPLGGAPPVFNEGLAHLVDCGPHRFTGSPTSREPRIERVLTREAWDAAGGNGDGELRQASASFSRFLIETEGSRAFGSFLKESRRNDDEDRVRELFRAHFGRGVEAALTNWRASEIPLDRGARCLFFEDACDDAPLVDALGGDDTVELDGSCLPQVVVVDPPEDATLNVTISSPTPGFNATVFPCDRFESDSPVIRSFGYTGLADAETAFSSWIDTGRWAIALAPDHFREAAPISLEVDLRSPITGCPDAPLIQLDTDHPTFTVGGDSLDLVDANVWTVDVTTPVDLRSAVFGPVRWEVCEPGCPLTDCRAIDEATVEPGSYNLVLRLLTAPGPNLQVWSVLVARAAP